MLSGVSLLGYLYNQKQREKHFIKENNVPLNKFANQYVSYSENKNNVCNKQFPTHISKLPNQSSLFEYQKENFGNLDNNTPSIDKGQFINQDYNNFIPANDPNNQYLLDINKREVPSFIHNNMVPFFGAKVTQNMAGTGVKSGNYIDGVDVDSGFDKSTPFQSKLANHTGIDDTYLNKREAGPLFSPAEQQTGYVFGQPLFREDEEQYKQSLTYRNDLAPTEKIMVGKGLNLDPSIPAAGGFHEFTRILPNNISDYKANQLENRVNAGKFVVGAELPTSYPGIGLSKDSSLGDNPNNTSGPGVPKNRPPKDYSQTRRPTMTTKVGFVSSLDELRSEWDVDKKPKNAQREQISYGYGNNELECEVNEPIGIAPARPGTVVGVRDPVYMSSDNNIKSKSDCNSQPIGNPNRVGQQSGPILANYYVNETDRGSINPTIVEQINLKGPNVYNNLSYTDQQKTTTKETTEFAYSGNAERQDKGSKFYTYEDLPKNTTKETTDFSYSGNVERQDKGSKFYTYEDLPKNTTKETTEFAYAGNPTSGLTSFVETSRYQYTGPDTDNKLESLKMYKGNSKSLGGAKTYTIKGSTLVKDYFPGAGRQNIRQDAEKLMGKVHFGTFGLDQNLNGPGTLAQSIPDGSRQQNNQFLAKPRMNPNKYIGVDDRQIASYQVEKLRDNPLSIYTVNPDSEVPSFYKDNKPDDYSDLKTARDAEIDDILKNQKKPKNENFSVNVYPDNNNVLDNNNDNNSNMAIVNSKGFNRMVDMGSSRSINNEPEFSGHAYSGKFSEDGKNPNEKTSDGLSIYGSTNNYVPIHPGDGGFIPTKDGKECVPNDALNFTGTLILDKL